MPSSEMVSMDGPVALGALARAFAHFGDFDRFVTGLQAALDRSPPFEQTTIKLDRALAEEGATFPAGVLTVPLAAGEMRFGALHSLPGGGIKQFGSEHLHLLVGLADFLSSALLASGRLQQASENQELLRFLLNQAPVGVAAFSADRRLIVANELATRWIGEARLPFDEFEKGSGGFHLRASGKLIYGEARRSAPGPSGSWLVVLHDLTPEQVRLLELMQRETYRMLAQHGRLGFALIESAHLRGGVLRRLSALRSALLSGEIAGPYDAHRIGVVFPGLTGLALRARLRKLRAIFSDIEGLRLGYAELATDGDTPEALLAAALQRHGPYDDIVRPMLLVHDDSAAVADTFAMVLGKEFGVVKSTSPERTRELLANETFEGFVTELELRNGVSGIELARYAREKQPGIQPFFTTVQRAPYGLPAGAADADAQILEKPFDISTLTQTVRAKLLD